jgi:hypothetical protein
MNTMTLPSGHATEALSVPTETTALMEHSSLYDPYDDSDEHWYDLHSETPMIEPMSGTSSLLNRVLQDRWKRYNDLLEQHPLLIKGVTTFFILSCGDVCGQLVQKWMEPKSEASNFWGIDGMRMIRFGALGLLGAPYSHYYFEYLDYYLPPTPEPFTWTTWIKLTIDQALQAPALLALIIAMNVLCKGDGLRGVVTEMRASYVSTLYVNCTW